MILLLADRGMTGNAIARQLDISPPTATRYMRAAGYVVGKPGWEVATRIRKANRLPDMTPAQRYKYRLLRPLEGRQRALAMVLA